MLSSIVEAHVLADVYRDKGVTQLWITERGCNGEEETTLDLTEYQNLKKLHVGNGSLNNVKELVLKGLSSLETVEIGDGCFLSCRRTVFESRFALSPE
mgnify:CR=1 FL=1